jgi:primosomal protein N' (replication factor Y)
VCERCQGQRFVPLAAGAERLGAELTRSFPDVAVAVLEGYGHDVPEPPAIVVTTRGSVSFERPADVGVVIIPDLDALVRRPRLDASEDALRLALTAGAWTGEVIVQTGEPAHPALQALIRWDPGGFWKAEAATRAELRFPPAASSVRIETADDPARVERELRQVLPGSDELLGPLPVDGRSVWLVKTDDRVETVEALRPLRHAWSRDSRDVRIEVDPGDVP